MPKSKISRLIPVALFAIVFSICIPSHLPAQDSDEAAGSATETKSQVSQPGATLFKIKISAGKYDRKNSFVDVPLYYDGIPFAPIVLVDATGNELPGYLTDPYYYDAYQMALKAGSTPPEKLQTGVRLQFVLPELAAGKSITLTGKRSKYVESKYKWHDDGSTAAELQYDDQPVIKYMYEEVDDGSPERRAETYKVFHHVYSPAGDRLLTKGAGGLFPHHRGIFFGFNRISYGDGKKADVWHCNNGESQISKFVINKTTPVTGRTTAAIAWNGQDGTPFAVENRELTVHKTNGATLIDFRSVLTSLVGEIKLDGDPQHAGVQFRASQEVPDHTKQLTYYLRPDGKAKPGEFRNWSNKKDETEINQAHINLPWHALCMALPENATESDAVKRYTICCLDAATNPKPARFSERDYGRFGSYFETTVDDESPLYVHYRYWIVDGEMTVEQVQSLSDQFAHPVNVELIK